MSSKKEARIEAKKRKIAAFLSLAQKEADVSTNNKVTGDVTDVSSLDYKASLSTDGSRKQLTELELKELREKLRERQKASMEHPKLFLRLDDLAPSGYMQKYMSGPPPLFVLDLQHLLLYAIQGNTASFKPRWCKLVRWTRVKKIVVVVLNGLDVSNFKACSQYLPALTDNFNMHAEMVSPSQYRSSVPTELFNVPISKTALKQKSMKGKANESQTVKTSVPVTLPISPNSVPEDSSMTDNQEHSFSRKDLLLSPLQLSQESYPLPVTFPSQNGQHSAAVPDPYSEYVFTKETYTEVTSNSPIFAIDCEMCLTNVFKHELARVAVVNEKYEVIYETLVKPRNTIRDYLTRYSGITAKMLKDVTTTIEDVQCTLQELLPPDAILCGHSLNADLNALQMFHPYVIDTSVIYNLSGSRGRKVGLRKLAEQFLGKVIQDGKQGHNPIEDAISTMELVQLKLKQGIEFGDVILGGVMFPLPELISANAESQEEPIATPPPEKKVKTDSNGDIGEDKKEEVTEKSVQTNRVHRSEASVTVKGRQGQWTVFLQRPGTSVSQSFFTLAKNENKKVCVIGCNEDLGGFVHEDGTFITAATDKQCVKVVSAGLQKHFMVYTELNTCQHMTESQAEKLCTKLNKRIKKLLKRLEDDTLVTVLLPGNTTDDSYLNALCLCNIFTPGDNKS